MAQERMQQIHERLQVIGLSDRSITVAATAAVLGAKEVLAIHGAGPDVLQIVYKAEAGQTPRTIADLRSGIAIKSLIREYYPNSRINEEESGDEGAKHGDTNVYYVDPLDGTSSYAEGQRYSTVGIAVYRDKSPFAAVIVHPFEQELVVAQVGKGTFLYRLNRDFMPVGDVRQLEVSKAKALAGGMAYIDALFNAKTSGPKSQFMAELVRMAEDNLGFRMSGSNIDQQLKVAKGSARLTLTDAVGGFFDLACGGLAITEAGGKFTGEDGYPVTESTQVAIGTNGPIHDDVLELVQHYYAGYRGFR